MFVERILPVSEPVGTLSDYLAIGGGEGLVAARENGPEWVIGIVAAAGLRERGGNGVPWAAVCGPDFVGSAADAEPGTFKDRYLIRRNPYQVVEGLLIAALATGANRATIVIKRRFEEEIGRLCVALEEFRDAGLLGGTPVRLVLGADQAFTNVETLAHVPEILRRGPEWFRSSGTETCPGTMLFTISGDVRRPGVAEFPLGISLRLLVNLVGGGAANGGRVRAVFPGSSGAILTEAELDRPLDYDSMELGSAGFVVYDDSACVVAATLAFARFHGSTPITECLHRIERGDGSQEDIDALLAGPALMRSAVSRFPTEFDEHLRMPCPLRHDLPVPKIVDLDEAGFSYDEIGELVSSRGGEP